MTKKSKAVQTPVTEAVAVVATPKALSKMNHAEGIFKSVIGTEGARKAFITQAQLPIEAGGAGLTKAGSGTYWQMLANEAKGNSRYTHHKSGKAKAGVEAVTVSTEAV